MTDITLPNLTPELQRELARYMDEATDMLVDIEHLREGLKAKTTDVADRLGIKTAFLTKALRTKFKESMEADRANLEVIQDLLDMASVAK